MERILALFADIKAYFKGISESVAKLTVAEDQVKALTGKVTTLEATLTERDTAIAGLNADLATAKTEASAKDSEITTLKATVETEKNRVTTVLASQGLTPEQLPSNTPDASRTPTAQAQVDTLRTQLATASPAEKFKISEQIKALLAKQKTA